MSGRRAPGSSSTGPARPVVVDLGLTQGFLDRTEVIAPDRLICPCCHHSVLTVDEQGSGIHCDKCGNSFRLARMRHRSAIDEIHVLGRFQLLERVGQGSFGAVWRARDMQLDRIVALKVPHEHALESGLDVERVEREARVAAQLRHPGIVRLYEILTLENLPVLVSDFIEGRVAQDRPGEAPAGVPRERPAGRADRRGAGPRARARARPPRHQAGQHHDGAGQSHRRSGGRIARGFGGEPAGPADRGRFRAGLPPRGRHDHDRGRRHRRHAGLHEPRAGGRQGTFRQPAQRHLQPGSGALPAPVRRAAFPGLAGHDRAPAHARGSPAAAQGQRPHPARPGDDLPEGPGQAAVAAVRHIGRAGRRPATLPAGRAVPGAAGGPTRAGLALDYAEQGPRRGPCDARPVHHAHGGREPPSTRSGRSITPSSSAAPCGRRASGWPRTISIAG